MWHLKNRENEQRGEKKREKGKSTNRLLTVENELTVTRVGIGG